MKYLFILLVSLVILSELDISEGKQDSHLQCYSCFITNCKDPALCSRTGEYLSQIHTSAAAKKSFNVSDLSICPSNNDLQDPKFIETSIAEPAACGKRVIKVFVTKYDAPAVSNGSSIPILSNIFSTSTEYPVLVPPKTPLIHEFVFTLFGVTDPFNDCDPTKYTQTKQNVTLESGEVLEFQAEFKKESECSQCASNLCNKIFIAYAIPAPAIPPPSGDSITGNGATKLISSLTESVFFLLVTLLILS